MEWRSVHACFNLILLYIFQPTKKMDSQGFNDLTCPEKGQKIRAVKTPEELTNLYDEWAKVYEEVRGMIKIVYTM